MAEVYEDAIRAVMQFYKITREECVEYYWDDVENYMSLMADINRSLHGKAH